MLGIHTWFSVHSETSIDDGTLSNALAGLNRKWLMPILKARFISVLFLGFVVLFCCEIQCAVWFQKGHASIILILSWAFKTRVLFSLHLFSIEFPCLFLPWLLHGYESINTKLNLMTSTVVYQKLKYQC